MQEIYLLLWDTPHGTVHKKVHNASEEFFCMSDNFMARPNQIPYLILLTPTVKGNHNASVTIFGLIWFLGPHVILNVLLLFVLVLQAVRHAQIMRRCGLKQVCCYNPVPTSVSGQSIPRHWVPNPHSLSPTRQSNMPMTWDE